MNYNEGQYSLSLSSVKMPYYNAGVQLEKNAVYIKLQSKVGIVVMWNGDDAVMVRAYKYVAYPVKSVVIKYICTAVLEM